MKDITLNVNVTDVLGNPVSDVEVTLTNNVTGLTSSRYSDGNGKMSHVFPGTQGDLLTFTTNGYKFDSSTYQPVEGPNYYHLTGDDVQSLGIVVSQSFKIPSRKQVISVKDNFCNLFDADGWPIFTPFISTLFFSNRPKANDWLARLKAAGSTHITIALSYDYAENLGWADRYPVEGRDFTDDLDSLVSVIKWLRANNLIINLKLACDGQHYDAVGKTYGWQWGMDNVPRIVRYLKAYKKWIIFNSGFDGCFPDWSPEQTVAFIRMLREVVDEDGTEGYIGTEFSGPSSEAVSYCHMGNGSSDWHNNQLDLLDIFEIEVLIDLNREPLAQEAVIELAQRLLDEGSKYFMRAGNKEQGIVDYENCAYEITRKRFTTEQAQAVSSQFEAEGFSAFGNGLPL